MISGTSNGVSISNGTSESVILKSSSKEKCKHLANAAKQKKVATPAMHSLSCRTNVAEWKQATPKPQKQMERNYGCTTDPEHMASRSVIWESRHTMQASGLMLITSTEIDVPEVHQYLLEEAVNQWKYII